MRGLSILLVLLLALAPPLAAEPVFPPGSSIGLEPPPGFTPSSSFSGFEDARTRSSLLLAELPAVSFTEIRERFSAGVLATQGLTETGRRSLRIAGNDALLIEGTQTTRGVTFSRWVLLLAASDFTGMVTANIMEQPLRPESAAAVTAALESIVVRRPDPAAQRAALPYAFEETPRLQFQAAMAGNGAVLSSPGTQTMEPARRLEQPSLIIVTSLERVVFPRDPRATAEAALRGLPHYRDLALEPVTEPEVAGLRAVRTEARAIRLSDGSPRRLVQWMIFLPEGGYLRAIAEAPEAGFEAMRPEFEQLVASLRRR